MKKFIALFTVVLISFLLSACDVLGPGEGALRGDSTPSATPRASASPVATPSAYSTAVVVAPRRSPTIAPSPVASTPAQALPSATPTVLVAATPITTTSIVTGTTQVTACTPKVDHHPPMRGRTWTPASLGGSVIVHLWTNERGYSQDERVLFLNAGEFPQLRGGGSSWNYPTGCDNVAKEDFEDDNSFPHVSLQQLRAEGLAQ